MTKKVKKVKKSTEKRQIWGTPSGSRPAFAYQPALQSRQKLKKYSFLFIFRCFSVISVVKSLKVLKWTKKVENGSKIVWPAFGCAHHP